MNVGSIEVIVQSRMQKWSVDDILGTVEFTSKASVINVISGWILVFPLQMLREPCLPFVDHSIESVGKACSARGALEIGVLCGMISSCYTSTAWGREGTMGLTFLVQLFLDVVEQLPHVKLERVIDHNRRSIRLPVNKIALVHGPFGIWDVIYILYPTRRDVKFGKDITAHNQLQESHTV